MKIVIYLLESVYRQNYTRSRQTATLNKLYIKLLFVNIAFFNNMRIETYQDDVTSVTVTARVRRKAKDVMVPGMILVDPSLTVIKGLVLENMSIETAKEELSLSRHDKSEEERSALKDKLEMENITSYEIHNVKVNGEEI